MVIDQKTFRLVRSLDGGTLQNFSSLAQIPQGNDLQSELVSYLIHCVASNYSTQTVTGMKRKLLPFVQFMAQALHITDPAQIREYHFDLFFIEKRKTCNTVTIRNFYRDLHAFFNRLVKMGKLKESPMIKMTPPKKTKYMVKPFSPDHIRIMLEMCEDSKFLGARNRAIILLFLDSGLRLTEMSKIQLADVNIKNKTIRIMGKGDKERLVPFGDITYQAILKYHGFRNSPLPDLWLTEERKPLSAGTIQETICRLGKRAGFTDVRCSPHTFRHTFATQSMIFGAPDWAVQTIMGHETQDMTKKYRESLNSQNAIEGYKGNNGNRGFSPVNNLLK